MKTKLVMMLGILAIATGVYAQTPNNSATDSENSDTCAWTFSSGSGPSLLTWCVSNHGNIVRFESPAGAEHIRNGTFLEGYAICNGTTVLAHDIGFTESGFATGVTILSGPSSSGITIRRLTLDGQWQLDQKFTRDNKENDVTVLMSLKRLGSGLADVRLARLFDPDVDGAFSVEEDRSDRGVWARTSRAVTLSNITYSQVTDTAYQSAFSPACSPVSLAVPRNGDDEAVVTARLGVMGTNNTKKTTFVYRRQ